MIQKISAEDLKKMQDREGLVLQGCGGDLREWEDGIHQMLAEEKILQNGAHFKEIYAFEHEGCTNLLFMMDGIELDTRRLVLWRLRTHAQFGGTWLSDYLQNRLGVPFPVSWTVKMKKKQKETQDILSYHTQAAGCSDKARAKASGGRQPIEECGRTGL
ncbi:MAG: hypothetical protein ACLSBB_08615 [Ruthenibacterium lactatiformans]